MTEQQPDAGASMEDRGRGGVLIIEDWPEDQRQFELYLEDVPNVSWGFAWNGFREVIPNTEEYILPLMRRCTPDVLLLDLAWTKEDEDRITAMQQLSGETGESEVDLGGFHFLDALGRCRKEHREFEDVYIIVVTQFSRDPIARAALRKGANEVLRKWESKIPKRINDALWISILNRKARRHE